MTDSHPVSSTDAEGGSSRRTRVLSWIADAAVVVIFVAVGRRSHDEGAGGIFVNALPFLAALQTGWLVAPRSRPTDLRNGVIVWAATVVLGLLLRLFTGDSAALGFIVVTTITLGVGILGWRFVVRGVNAARRKHLSK
jgi:hypothetical protein